MRTTSFKSMYSTNALERQDIPSFAEPAIVQYTEIHMGVPVRITVSGGLKSSVDGGIRAAFDAFARLEQILSDYRPTSELMLLCSKPAQQPHRVSEQLFTVLRSALTMAVTSKGAFDPTCGPFVHLWRQSSKTLKLPTAQALAHAKASTGFQHLILNDENMSVTLNRPNMKIDLGGIAKGTAVDAAARALRSYHIKSFMIEAGGDIFTNGVKAPGVAWRIQVGTKVVDLLGALSISGDASQHVIIGKRRFSHIIDPRTGLGMESPSHVVVRSGVSEVADATATAACVLGPRKASMLKSSRNFVDIEFIDRADVL